MTEAKTGTGNERLVVEIVGAHNLMPKDGEDSSSPFVEVQFENQRLRTKVKPKDLNPIWNEKLVFHVIDVNDLRHKALEINVYNEKRSSNSRNFLGKVRVLGSSVGREGESVVQLYTLEKRSLFSSVRGEISVKHYMTTTAENGENVRRVNRSGGSKKSKKVQNVSSSMAIQQQQQQQQQQISLHNHNRGNQQQSQQNGQGQRMLPFYPHQSEIKPLVITALPSPMPGPGPRPIVYSNGSSEFSLRETKPCLGGTSNGLGGLSSHKDKTSSTYDLVEQMQYLYVNIVKAKDLSVLGEVVSEVKLGNYRGVTKKVSSNSSNPEWNQVFVFSKERIQSSVVELFVKEGNKDEYTGRVLFDLSEIPTRVPPDSPLAPQWYKIENRNGGRGNGELMVSVWFGTQADEAFAEAWHSKAGNVHIEELSSIKSKVYLSPKLWYLRISVIEAQDVAIMDKGSSLMRFPELSAKLQVGSQILRTAIASAIPTKSFSNPYWNEDLMFVVAEPFEDCVTVVVEDRLNGGAIGGQNDVAVGRVQIPISAVERRTGDTLVGSRWFSLDNGNNNNRFGSRIHLRLSLDGGYHVLDEATMYNSDVRPTAKELWKPQVGLLEIGILSATGLMPMKVRDGKCGGIADSYCVAKYGPKWVRTRTVVDSLCPKWNEQYTWEVYDPCTVVTVGVFDNARVNENNNSRDVRIGKVRIRLSTLETGRVYTHSYPLIVLHPSGVKKTGELHLAVRLSCGNAVNMLHMYALPLLPKMHYTQPLGVHMLERLRYQTLNAVAARLSRAEPPLGREVVEYMLDHDFHVWSMRRSKANFFRLVNVISGLVAVAKLVEVMRSWSKPVYSTVFVLAFLFMVLFPELLLPCLLLYTAAVGVWRFRRRSRYPPHMDARISHAETVFPDELDEEFDTFPTSRGFDVVRMRYDRVRSIAGRVQTVVGDMASQGERVQALLSWRDPRATFLFLMFCLLAAVGFYTVPVKLTVAISGLYYLRPPRFRRKLPSRGLSFFRRLPSRADSLL
ncbi:putative C2 domain, phosphoribosyltransferase, C2 domain superfamily [Arabidopsis thaliana]|uniref:C2 domain-containing protein n=3 Tax=Arabidopsis TaxID=3701 RepID=A0A178WEY7_ARATH|nr:C2 domain [Arabidopsis suecica]KAG7645019.1 C2 domain [Arabidopsis thaliana x Arabidopsis arenosa]OAP15612.1 hypothetical protein AXX17_AT1G03440 [Arabidopsis thaliana]